MLQQASHVLTFTATLPLRATAFAVGTQVFCVVVSGYSPCPKMTITVESSFQMQEAPAPAATVVASSNSSATLHTDPTQVPPLHHIPVSRRGVGSYLSESCSQSWCGATSGDSGIESHSNSVILQSTHCSVVGFSCCSQFP